MRNPITQQGYNDLLTELNHRTAKTRLEIANEIEIARGHGDSSENTEFDYAKDRQSSNVSRIAYLQNFLSSAEIMTTSNLTQDGRVVFGVRTKLLNCDKDTQHIYRLVGETESDIPNGKLSYKSPLARAILGTRAGEIVEFETPKGVSYYEVLDVIYD